MLETFEELPEMHPLDFRDYWGLTNEEAAYYLRVTAAAIASYETHIHVKRRKPSLQVMGLAGELHEKWLAKNKVRKVRKSRPSYSGTLLATA